MADCSVLRVPSYCLHAHKSNLEVGQVALQGGGGDGRWLGGMQPRPPSSSPPLPSATVKGFE